jgi:[ribosomal protein S5]-alanine N-acetyltransferase
MSIYLETERLILRNFLPDDWSDMYEYLALPEIFEFEPGEPFDGDEAVELAEERSKGDTFIAVDLASTGKMIGHLYFSRNEPLEHASWELGFIFNPAYHRNGYAREACAKIIDYAFMQLGAHRIVSYCNPLNTASWKLLEKIGMRREGHFVQNLFNKRDPYGNPAWHDTFAYAVLKDEWR